jgi:hypothetical protein
MPRRRVRLRPPGLKPWTRIGTLGPFRGRLGLSWVLAALVVGVPVLAAGSYALLRPHPPGGTFVPVGAESAFAEGTARAVDVPGAFVGRVQGGFVAVLQEDGCSLSVVAGTYRDCRGVVYDLDGAGAAGCGGLDLLLVRVYRDTVYIDPDHPATRSPAPAPGGSC